MKKKTSAATHDANHVPKSDDQHRIRWRLACLLPALIVLLASFLFPANRIHEDEIYWIGSSYFYQLAVVEGDASNPDWQLLPARENPVLGKYVMGLALQLAGHPITTPDLLGSFYLIFADIPGAWGTGEAFEKRLAVATKVTPSKRDLIRSGQELPLDDSQLVTTRRTSVVFGMLAAIGIAVIGQQCKWKAGGLIAGVLFSLHPIVIESCGLAMIDIIALAFSIWFMIGIINILGLATNPAVECDHELAEKSAQPASSKQRSRDDADRATVAKQTIFFSSRKWLQQASITLLTGILLAFACGSKMNSLVVAATAAICGMWYVAKLVQQQVKINRSSEKHKTTDDSEAQPISTNVAIRSNQVSMLLFVAIIAVFVFIGSNPTLYGDPIDGVMALSYEHTLTADIQEIMLGGRLNRVSERLRALADLVCGGPIAFTILCLIVAWAAYDCTRNRSMGIVVLLWWSIALLLLIMWMPFAWERYTLPIIPPTMLILGAVTERAGCWLWSKLPSVNRQEVSTNAP